MGSLGPNSLNDDLTVRPSRIPHGTCRRTRWLVRYHCSLPFDAKDLSLSSSCPDSQGLPEEPRYLIKQSCSALARLVGSPRIRAGTEILALLNSCRSAFDEGLLARLLLRCCYIGSMRANALLSDM